MVFDNTTLGIDLEEEEAPEGGEVDPQGDLDDELAALAEELAEK